MRLRYEFRGDPGRGVARTALVIGELGGNARAAHAPSAARRALGARSLRPSPPPPQGRLRAAPPHRGSRPLRRATRCVGPSRARDPRLRARARYSGHRQGTRAAGCGSGFRRTPTRSPGMRRNITFLIGKCPRARKHWRSEGLTRRRPRPSPSFGVPGKCTKLEFCKPGVEADPARVDHAGVAGRLSRAAWTRGSAGRRWCCCPGRLRSSCCEGCRSQCFC